jgi:hypothetical protein
MGLKPLPTLVEFVPKMMNRTWPFLLGSALFGVPLVIKSRNTSRTNPFLHRPLEQRSPVRDGASAVHMTPRTHGFQPARDEGFADAGAFWERTASDATHSLAHTNTV